MPRCACAVDTEAGDQGPYDAKQVPSSGNCLSGKLSDCDSDLAPDKRRYVKTRSLVCERLNGPAGAGVAAHYYGIATEELNYCYASDANPARDDSNLTIRRCVWNHFQYSSPISSEFIRAGRRRIRLGRLRAGTRSCGPGKPVYYYMIFMDSYVYPTGHLSMFLCREMDIYVWISQHRSIN